MARGRTVRTLKKRAAFLCALEQSPHVGKACEAAKISRRGAYDWRTDDPEFAAAWDAALEVGITAAEDEAWRRATEGTTKPVFYKGVQCGGIQEHSDTLLIFLLKAHRPEVYSERGAVPLTDVDDYVRRAMELVLTYVPEDRRDELRRAMLALPLRTTERG